MVSKIIHPKVSILIPVFNREQLIGACIESALLQTFSDIEVIVVDNASTDDTWAVIQQYVKKDNRINAFRNDTNLGPVHNWIRCVSEAQGELGKILFSDDLLYPHFLEQCIPYLEDVEVAFVQTAALIGECPDNGIVRYKFICDEKRLFREQYFELLIPVNGVQLSYSPCSALMRMSDIKENLQASFPTNISWDFTKNGAGPDLLLLALTALKYKYVVMLPDTGVFFRAHPGSFTILNTGNKVTNGWHVALAWFFRNKLSGGYWEKYVAWLWLSEIKNKRKYISPKIHGLKYEGAGTKTESLTLLVAAFSVLSSAFIKRYFPKVLK